MPKVRVLVGMVGLDFQYRRGDVVDVDDDTARALLDGRLAEEAHADEEPTAARGRAATAGPAADSDESPAPRDDPDVGSVEAIWAQWVDQYGEPGEAGLDVVVDDSNGRVAIRHGAGPGELYWFGDAYEVDFDPKSVSVADELEGLNAKETLEFAANGPACAAFVLWAEEAADKPRVTVLRALQQ